MTSSPGSRVQMRHDVGTVRRVLARGWGYAVEFTDGQTHICMADVLSPCPENVVPLPYRAWDRAFTVGGHTPTGPEVA
jgi:hypothetical protein